MWSLLINILSYSILICSLVASAAPEDVYVCLCMYVCAWRDKMGSMLPSQCLLMKAEWIPAGLHHELTGAVRVSLPIKPLCLVLDSLPPDPHIAASLEMLRKGEGDLRQNSISPSLCSSHLCTTAQKYAWMSLFNVCSPARWLGRSLSPSRERQSQSSEARAQMC